MIELFAHLFKRPTVKPTDLPKEIDLTEGYLWLEVIVPNNFPQEAASFVILNHSVDKDLKRLVDKELFDHHIECRSLLKTLKYMDNNLDKLFEKAIAIKSQPAPVVEKKQPSPNKGPLIVKMKETREKEEKEKQKEKEREIERLREQEKPKEKAPVLVLGSWTQEEQKKLEQAIVEFKDIKDAKEKWTKIGERVGKTMSECVQRFKDCRKAAEEQKNNPPEEQKINETKPAEEEEEESGEEEEGSDEEDSSEGHESDENNEEQKANRRIRDQQEYDSTLESVVLAKSMRLENVSVGHLISIQVQVSCKDCKCIHEAEAQKETDSEYLVNNDKCPRCGTKSRLVAKQEIFHDNSNAVCLMGSFTWDVRDIHFCEFDLTCAFCDTANRTKKIIAGQPVYMECKGCFKKMTFSYMALTMAAMNLNQVEDEEEGTGPNVTDIMKKIFAKKNKFEFKVGLPLPNNGSCKHCKGSNRYFRFPCCGKAFACDECHNTVEKGHEMILAKNMICGWCSSEQPVDDFCKRCAKATRKIVRKTAYWEGGKGTRNVAAMSRKDPHKFKGLGKTISTKQKNKTEKKSKN